MPLIKSSRVPADLVAECLDPGETVDEIAYNYDLKPADILRLKQSRDSLTETAGFEVMVAAVDEAIPGSYHEVPFRPAELSQS